MKLLLQTDTEKAFLMRNVYQIQQNLLEIDADAIEEVCSQCGGWLCKEIVGHCVHCGYCAFSDID